MLAIPDSFVVSDQRARLTGPELREEIDAIARGLLAQGLAPGDRVLVLGRKSVELATAMLAVPRAGGVVIAPFAGLTGSQLRHIVDDATPALALCLDSATPAARAVVDDLVATVGYEALRDAGEPERELPDPAPGDPALIIYTSGSTGKPKGVVFSRENIALGAESVAAFYELTPGDRVLCMLPFSFDAGFNQFTSAIAAGCETHLRDFALAQHAAAVCAEHEITVLTGVPALWRKLAAVAWPDAARRSMRRWGNTGGHMPADLSSELCALFPNSEPILMYGFTEAFRATYLPPALYERKPTSVGIAIPHAAVAVVDDAGELCAPGQVGQLLQFGPLVTLGYWNREEDNRRVFAPLPDRTRAALRDPANVLYDVAEELVDRVAWSGDDVVVDEDGHVYFRSRRTALIKSQGFRVSASEIEDACLATGLVREAVALGVELDGDEAIAVIARPDFSEVTPDHLRKTLVKTLPGYQVPRVIRFRDALPTTPNGKYDMQSLKQDVAVERAS